MTSLRLRAALAAAILGAATPSLVSAEEAAESEKRGWGGEAELGVVSTTGNSDTESVNAALALTNELTPWRHEVHFEALHTSDSGETTAERYLMAGKSEYRFEGDRRYLFGTLRYEDDRFAGYDYRISETFGYGWRVLDRPDLTLDLEAGAGGRHTVYFDDEREDEPIVRLAGGLGWDVSDTARMTQNLFVETGAENTYTESVSALKLKINSNLATKFTYTVRHNSSVPTDTENTDTVTAVTLVLDF